MAKATVPGHEGLTTTTSAASTADLSIGGMTCASCAVRIEKVLGRQPGVANAQVNFATSHASLVYDPGETNVEALRRAVEDIGYQMTPVDATSPLPDGEGAEARAWWWRAGV